MSPKTSASRFFKYLSAFEDNGWAMSLHPTARWLYFQLLRKGDKVGWEEGLCIPNVELLRITGVSRTSAYEALESIASKKLITLRKGHRGKSRTIILNLDLLDGFPPSSDTETHDVEFQVESGQPDASGEERVRSAGLKRPVESGFESGEPEHMVPSVFPGPPDTSREDPPKAPPFVQFSTDAQQGIFDVTGCPPFFDCPKMAEALGVAHEAGCSVVDVVAECVKAVPRMGVGTYSIRRFIPTIKQMAVVAEGKKPVSMLDKYSGPEHDAAYKRLMGGKA
jgi:hypothetical protein